MKTVLMLSLLLQYGCAGSPFTCKPQVLMGSEVERAVWGMSWVRTTIDGGMMMCGRNF